MLDLAELSAQIFTDLAKKTLARLETTPADDS